MEKHFYVVVPFATSAIRARSLFGQLLKKETLEISDQDLAQAKTKLTDRVETVRGTLASIGLELIVLSNEQLKQLLYATYNPAEAGEVAIQPSQTTQSVVENA